MLDFDENHLDKYSDEQLLDFLSSTGTRPLSRPPCAASLLSPNLVMKLVPSKTLTDGVAAQNLARDLVIRVPEIKRTITNEDISYIIMDRVHGVTLEQCWSELGWIATITLAFELRKFVRRMREVTSSTAGGLVTGECNSIWLEDYYGLPLNATPSDVQSFITFWLQYPQTKARLYPDPEMHRRNLTLTPSLPTRFVFIHQDLAPRNILIDEHRRMWLIDWESAGYYPLYFEYVGMQNFHYGSWNIMDRLRWWIFSWLSVGVYSQELQALDKVREYSISYVFGRSIVSGIRQNRRR
jgi:serine/threonine protein kinase